MRQHVIGHGDQRILLAEHRPVLAHQRQAVDIRIDHDPQIGFFGRHARRNLRQVRRNRLRIVREMPVRSAVQFHHLDAQFPEQRGDHHAADRIDRIDDHFETGGADRVPVDQLQGEHPIDMRLIVTCAIEHVSDAIHVRERITVRCGDSEHPLAFGIVQKFAARIEQLQRIPLFRVVAGRQNNPAVGPTARHGHFDGRRRSQTDIDHVDTATAQRPFDDRSRHFTRQPRVATDHDRQSLITAGLFQPLGVGRRKLRQIDRRQVVARLSADRPPYSGN